MEDKNDPPSSLGLSIHNDPELGTFFRGLTGSWRLASKADFPFQSDVDLIFDAKEASEQLPEFMKANVTWVQNNMAEIWNSAAAALNEMPELGELEMPDGFALDGVFIEVPAAKIESAEWRLSMDISYQQVSFLISFHGLRVIGQQCQ